MCYTTSMNPTKTSVFEHTSCGRCGGSGQMPFAVYAGRCFKCGGAGIVYTKRGAAAKAFFANLLKKRVADLIPGEDKVLYEGAAGIIPGGWFLVNEIVPSTQRFKSGGDTEWRVAGDEGKVDIKCEGFQSNAVDPESLVRVARTKEFKINAREQAVAYQETLTKAGTVRKR